MRCLGAMVTRKHFGTAVPPAIMSMPVQPGHDDKDAMWQRLNCEERIYTPIEDLAALSGEGLEDICKDLKANAAMSSLIYVVHHWRCNNVVHWPALVEKLEDVIYFLLALGYHKECPLLQDLLLQQAQGVAVIKEFPAGWSKTANQTGPGETATLGTPVAPKEKQDFRAYTCTFFDT